MAISLGNLQQYQQLLQHQQQQQRQQQYPFLAAVSGNNHAYGQQRAYTPALLHPIRSLAAAGTNLVGAYTGNVPSAYGNEHSDGPDVGYSYHPASGSGYEAPMKKKESASSKITSIMQALTLLSFFGFINILQGCLKEQMETLNPTVMVMTTGVVRNRYNKLAEMNSRERTTSPLSTFPSGGNIVVEPADLISVAASSSSLAAALSPTVTLKAPSSIGGSVGNVHKKPVVTNLVHNNNNNYNNDNNNNDNVDNYNNSNEPATFSSSIHHHEPARPEFYDSMHTYPNRTLVSPTSTDNQHNYQQQQQQQEQQEHYYQQHYSPHYASPHADSPPWSYGHAVASSLGFDSHRPGSSTYDYRSPGLSSSLSSSSSSSSHSSSSWPSVALSAHSGGSNYFDDDRYGDSHYTRIN